MNRHAFKSAAILTTVGTLIYLVLLVVGLALAGAQDCDTTQSQEKILQFYTGWDGCEGWEQTNGGWVAQCDGGAFELYVDFDGYEQGHDFWEVIRVDPGFYPSVIAVWRCNCEQDATKHRCSQVR